MTAAGIDIGSRTVKLAVLDPAGRLVGARVEANTHDPVEVCRRVLDGAGHDRIVATGYGRRLFGEYWKAPTITEIRAAALGARRLFPSAGAVLDIGGQDTKVILLDRAGAVARFEMNDRCAAGTGRFLEVMAAALALSLPDFSDAAARAPRARTVTSMCAVFAETEVVSMVARGAPRDELALGIHLSVAARAVSMLRKVGADGDVVFCGGVALNPCLVRLVEEGLGRRVLVPENPQVLAALGCALAAREDAPPGA